MDKVITTEGALVIKAKDDKGNVRYTPEQLEAHCKECNERAETMGLKTRYQLA